MSQLGLHRQRSWRDGGEISLSVGAERGECWHPEWENALCYLESKAGLIPSCHYVLMSADPPLRRMRETSFMNPALVGQNTQIHISICANTRAMTFAIYVPISAWWKLIGPFQVLHLNRTTNSNLIYQNLSTRLLHSALHGVGRKTSPL